MSACHARVCFLFPGEWEGICATFDAATGAADPLPERYVPGAFAEWGVVVSDWQVGGRTGRLPRLSTHHSVLEVDHEKS